MKKINTLLLICCAFLCSNSLYAADIWQHLPGEHVPSKNQQVDFPRQYSVYYLDQAAMKGLLDNTTLSPEHPVMITLPTLDGKYRDFAVWEMPVMAPELQAQFPDIRTYTGVAVDDPTVTTKISYNLYGFRAFVYTPQENYFVSPYSRTPDGYYLVYSEKDKTGGGFTKGICGVSDNLTQGAPSTMGSTVTPSPGKALRQNGDVRHYYRCAISCTGEWANAVTGGAPSVNGVLSIITSVLNGANGVFERELSVHMILIPQETQVIYIDPNTDPFPADGPNGTLIDENQTNFNTVFPTGAEYDIGHIFNTVGGGLAQLSSICSGDKAKGVSSANGPNDFSVIIHEMGHQMGSNHVFNSNIGGCSGNGVEQTAYETGSGSTIMCYNGVCDADNTQPSPVDYYHVYTLDAISELLSSMPGCGTDSVGYPPVDISGADMVLSYNIPKNTPFELYAPEATPHENNPAVTYTWEEWDLGHFGEAESGCASWDAGPIMQSMPPSTSRLRTFPELSVLLNGGYAVVGQRLPTAERDMQYRITARSYKNGWGTFNTNIAPVAIHVANAQFRVSAPGADQDGEEWQVGSVHQITWDTGGSRAEPVSCGYVDIYISYDGGHTFSNEVVAGAPNTGSYNYTVDDLYSDNVRFKVKGHGNIFFDISKANIKIHGNPLAVNQINDNKLIAIYPNPATDVLNIRNNASVAHLMNVNLYNIDGRLVWSGDMQQRLDINVNAFARGVYVIHFYDTENGKRYAKKIVLQ